MQERLARDVARGVTSDLTGLLSDGLSRLGGATLSFWVLKRDIPQSPTGAQSLLLSVQFPGMEWGPDLPIFITRTASEPEQHQEVGTAKKKGEPPTPEEKQQVTLEIHPSDYAETVLALAKAARINVVADAFTLRERLSFPPGAVELEKALDHIGKVFRLRRRWQQGVLLLRSREWEDRLEQEPPAAVLDRLVKEKQKGVFPGLTLPDLAFAAARLTRAQTKGLANWTDGKNGLGAESSILHSAYSLYRWCGTLSDDQMRSLAGSGLALSSLFPVQKEALAQLAKDRAIPDYREAVVIAVREGRRTIPAPLMLELRTRDGKLIADLR